MKKSVQLMVVLSCLMVSCTRTQPKLANQSAAPEATVYTAKHPIKVVATTGMVSDVVSAVGGELVAITTLMGPGVDPHLYKASAGDVQRLSRADAIFYSGLVLEGKMTDILVKMARHRPTVAVTEALDETRLREPPEFAGHHDPHVWFDIDLWSGTISVVAKALAEIDPAHTAMFRKRAAEYTQKLAQLEQWARAELATVPSDRRVLVTAHDAFGYFGVAYDFEVIGLQGISTVAEFGIADVERIVKMLVTRKIPAVFVESSVPKRSIEAVLAGAQAQGHTVVLGGELFSDAMGPLGSDTGTYEGMIRHNVQTIVNALRGVNDSATPGGTSMSTPAISVRDLTVAYEQKPVLWDIHTDIPEGKLVAIVGPNGAGKSTLIKSIMGLLPTASGEVLIYKEAFAKQRHLLGYVPQRSSVDWDFPTNAFDVVLMGRYGKLSLFRRPSAEDKKTAKACLAKVGMEDFADRQISQLSGGQQQRVFLARALAQDAQIYLMDEPFAGVDATTEKAIVSLLRELQGRGKTVIVVHHDLQTVTEYFDWVCLLNGRMVAQGPTTTTFTPEHLAETYGGQIKLLTQIGQRWLDQQRGRKTEESV